MPRHIRENEYDAIKGMVEDGYMQKAIAEKVGRSPATISKIARSEDWFDYIGIEREPLETTEEVDPIVHEIRRIADALEEIIGWSEVEN